MVGDPARTAATLASKLRARTSLGALQTMPSFESPDDVLYANELMRGRLWVALSALLSLGGIACALLFQGPGALAQWLLAAGCGVVLIASVIGLMLLRNDARYSAELAAVYGYLSLVAVLPAFYFFGWFSPIALIVALGAVIYAMGHTNRAVLSFAVAVVACHATLGALTIAGTLPDRGVAMVRVGETANAVLCLAMCEGLFLVAFALGRQLRGHALLGIQKYGEVIRENTRRETLLQEAADDLKRAQNIGGPGRYTGLVLGPFELGIVLGRGGMGEVYAATSAKTSERAAVKVITPSGGVNDRTITRFQREIELAAAIHSPYIVRVLGHSAPDDGVLYLAMERLEGASLSEELRSLRSPSTRYVLAMLRQVSRGITDAHDAGVVHRDLTPHNIFHHTAGGDDVWKILDFGVSKFVGSEGSLTGGGLVGTPNYMSPEQASGGDIDGRTDLFALGCIAYRCLTGRPAFRGNAMADVLYRVVHDMPPRPSSLATMPPQVDRVLAVALAKDRNDRFERADEFVRALEQAFKGTISEELESHSASLLLEQPWGQITRLS